jgi:S-DNA-T family DNA segregation ATPase FtsK/SpoIIIE
LPAGEQRKIRPLDEKKRDIFALCLLITALLLLLSLVSFSADDLTLLNAAGKSPRPTRNWIGSFGAHAAWGLVYLFGAGAYWLPTLGFWGAWRFLRSSPPATPRASQVFGVFLLTLSSITLGALVKPTLRLFQQEMATGGVVGQVLAELLKANLHPLGSAIVVVGILFSGLVLTTSFSVGTTPLRALRNLVAPFSALTSWWRCRPQRHAPAPAPPAVPRSGENTVSAVREADNPRRLLPRPVVTTPAAKPRRAAEALPVTTLGDYRLPPLDLLDIYETENSAHGPQQDLQKNALVLEEKLADFGVQGQVIGIQPGPVITMYEYAPAPGIKISKIVSLSDDLAMALRAMSIRVVAPIPGKAAIGIEIPNEHRQMVSLRAVLQSEAFTLSPHPLTLALGKDIVGQPVVANLGRMPHLLVAGATGTGKSVCINALLSSLLYRNSPREVRFLLIDPKRIELSSYEGIPHLLHPVVTDAKMATRALRWAVQEMEWRYRLLADKGARNIEGYNKLLAREGRERKTTDSRPALDADAPSALHHHPLPYLILFIDELADLMMVASRDVEESIIRLAQMARAAGIHLVLATQRPSVDVLTGIIKANIPTRVSFQVSSRIDSRTILDTNGAESLLGAGDMLFLPPGTAKLQRIHGAFISDVEVQRLTRFWSDQELSEDPLRARVNFEEREQGDEISADELDEKYQEALQLVLETRQASISMLQRRLRVGYNRAARMIEIMEQQGHVGPSDGVKPREVFGSGRS